MAGAGQATNGGIIGPQHSPARTAPAGLVSCGRSPSPTIGAASPSPDACEPPQRSPRSPAPTNQRTISSGSASRSVQRNACGLMQAGHIAHQNIADRHVLAGWCQIAVPETNSISRSPPPYQPSTQTRRQAVLGSARRSARLGRRCPTMRGRPRCSGPPAAEPA